MKPTTARRGEVQPLIGSTRERIISAAVATLREEGFAGTSARSIARRGKFNQALIFYHFGTVLDVFVTTLETVSAERLAQYRAAVADVPDLRTALAVAREQYETDVREGHITVLVELVAGASSVPLLGREIVRCMEPWIVFSEEGIRRFLGGTPLESLIPAREAAHALLSIYLGMELLDHLDPMPTPRGRCSWWRSGCSMRSSLCWERGGAREARARGGRSACRWMGRSSPEP